MKLKQNFEDFLPFIVVFDSGLGLFKIESVKSEEFTIPANLAFETEAEAVFYGVMIMLSDGDKRMDYIAKVTACMRIMNPKANWS